MNLKNSCPIKISFLLSRVLSVPLWALVTLLPYILYKDLKSSIFLVTLTTALKPLSALLAPYFSLKSHHKPRKVIKHLIRAHFLRFLPFLILPFCCTPWYILTAFFIYMVFSRGITPTWMELIKQYVKEGERESTFQLGNTFEYIGMILTPFFLGKVLDLYPQSWRFLFPISALFGMSTTLFLLKIKEPPLNALSNKEPVKLLTPFYRSYQLLNTHPDFLHYILGFMLGGTGLMIIHPVLSVYYIDELHLSYKEILIALSLCKGIGFALSSNHWIKLFKKITIFHFSSLVAILATFFSLMLLLAKIDMHFLYLSFLLYGIMQSGSELSWHMSGIVFSMEKESTLFSNTNILAIGLRGCVVPFAGYLLLSFSHSMAVIAIGALFSLLGSLYLMRYAKRTQKTTLTYNSSI